MGLCMCVCMCNTHACTEIHTCVHNSVGRVIPPFIQLSRWNLGSMTFSVNSSINFSRARTSLLFCLFIDCSVFHGLFLGGLHIPLLCFQERYFPFTIHIHSGSLLQLILFTRSVFTTCLSFSYLFFLFIFLHFSRFSLCTGFWISPSPLSCFV